MLKIAYYLTLVCSSKVLSRGTSSRYIKFDLRIIIIGVSPLLNVTSYNVLIVLRLLYSCHSVSFCQSVLMIQVLPFIKKNII